MAGKDLALLDGRNFLAKPYVPAKLLHMVRESLDRRLQTEAKVTPNVELVPACPAATGAVSAAEMLRAGIAPALPSEARSVPVRSSYSGHTRPVEMLLSVLVMDQLRVFEAEDEKEEEDNSGCSSCGLVSTGAPKPQ